MDINKWDDAGDWSSLAAIESTPILPRLEAIRKAVAERRYSATGLKGGILADDYNLQNRWIRPFANDIDFNIRQWMDQAWFANQTDNGGNWEGLNYCAPSWDMASILSAIGADEYLLAPHRITAPWIYQCYLILNLLKWPVFYHLDSSTGWSKSGSGDNWDEAIADYNAATWQENYNASPTQNVDVGYGSARVTRQYGVFSRFPWMGKTDVYLKPGRPALFSEYSNPDYPIAENTYGKIYFDSTEELIQVGKSGDITITEPSLGLCDKGWVTDDHLWVTKPDYAFQA